MTLLALIDYGFIVVFFMGLALLVLFMEKPHPQEEAALKAAVSPEGEAVVAPQRGKTAAYGLLAALFVLLIVLTFLDERQRSSLASS